MERAIYRETLQAFTFAAGCVPLSPPASPSAQSSEAHELSVPVDQLREELRVLRIAIDELRDDVVWAARQVLSAGYEVAPSQMPRRPLDPLAPDADYQYRMPASRQPHPSSENSEPSPYCCENPRLTWNGDPEAPGVACESCGYVIAEQGDVIVQRDNHPIDAKSLLQSSDEPSVDITADTEMQTISPPPIAPDSPETLSATTTESPVESPPAAQTATSASDAAPARGKRPPLYMRIYQQPLLTEIVRAVGYEQLAREEVLRRLEPMAEKYGRERTIENARELLARLPGQHDIWALTDDVAPLIAGASGSASP